MSQRVANWLMKVSSFLNIINVFSSWVNVAGMVSFFLLVTLTFVNVILRYVFNVPIAGNTDIIMVGLVVVVFFGIAYTQSKKGHVAMDIVTNRLSPRKQIVMNTIVSLFAIVLFVMLIWRSSLNVVHFYNTNFQTGTLAILAFPFAALVPFGCTLVLLLYIRDLLENVAEALRQHFGIRHWLLMFGIPILVTAFGAFWMQPTWQLNPLIVAVVGIAVCFGFFLTGLPIAYSLLAVGFLFMSHIRGTSAGLNSLGSTFYQTIADYSFAVIAFFVLMGYLVFFARLGEDIYRAAYRWLGHLLGGLIMTTIAACTAMGAVVAGSGTEIVALGPSAWREMDKFQYDRTFAIGSVISASILGALIPPSTFVIIYALLTELSIGKLFIAIIIPGLITMLAFMGLVYVRCLINPKLAPPAEKSNWKDRVTSLKTGGPVAALFVLVIGGLYVGMFTPTEAGAIGAMGAFFIALIMRRLNWKTFVEALLQGGRMACMSYILLGAATIFGYFIAASKLPMELGNLVARMALPGMLTIGAMMIVYIILGAIMPAIPMLIITMPIFYPIVLELGFDPIWFGVLVTVIMCLATISPPFGINLFIAKQVSGESISVVYRGVLPFCIVTIAIVVVLMIFPDLATWLPSLME